MWSIRRIIAWFYNHQLLFTNILLKVLLWNRLYWKMKLMCIILSCIWNECELPKIRQNTENTEQRTLAFGPLQSKSYCFCKKISSSNDKLYFCPIHDIFYIFITVIEDVSPKFIRRNQPFQMSSLVLNLKCITSQNGQTHFKYLAANSARF